MAAGAGAAGALGAGAAGAACARCYAQARSDSRRKRAQTRPGAGRRSCCAATRGEESRHSPATGQETGAQACAQEGGKENCKEKGREEESREEEECGEGGTQGAPGPQQRSRVP